MHFSNSLFSGTSILLLNLLFFSSIIFVQASEQIVMSSPKVSMDTSIPKSGTDNGPGLIECLTVERQASMFYDYMRDSGMVMQRLSSRLSNTTLLVPIDKAIIALPRRPHQESNFDAFKTEGMSTEEAIDRARESTIQHFVHAHTIPLSIPFPPSVSESYPTLLDGHTVSFEKVEAHHNDEGGYRVNPGGARVLYTKEAVNGWIYFLDGTVPA